MGRYGINVALFLRTDILGYDIELPYSEELDEAVLLINRICGEEVRRRDEHELDIFLIEIGRLLKEAEGTGVRELLRQVYDFKR